MVRILTLRSLGAILSFILLHLLALTWGLNLPAEICGPGSACTTNATSTNTSTRQGPPAQLQLPNTDTLSLTALPPDPFEFIVANTDFRIIFTKYGGSILLDDATGCVFDAIEEIKNELETHWTDDDIPISRDLSFPSGSAELKLNTAQYMYRTYCLMLMVGIMEWGHKYGFLEVDMEFVQQKGRARRTLGTGSLLLRAAES